MAWRSLSPRAFFRVKAALFVLSLAPAAMMAVQLPNTADPAEFLIGETGEFALRFLVVTLAITPLVRLTGINWLMKLRRMFGLYTFFYAFAHFETYLLLDLQLDFSAVLDDIIERKYITVGFAAFLLLLPLAITSNNWMIRRMGARRWTRLHKAVYIIAPLAALHFFWLKRGDDWTEPLVYVFIFAGLLAMRYPPVAARVDAVAARLKR